MERSQSQPTSFAAVMFVTFTLSLGTGVFWHGLPFIAEQDYEFSQARNLAMFVFLGSIYTAGAFASGALLRRIVGTGTRLSLRGALMLCVGVQTAACLLPIAVDREWAVWVAAAIGTILYSFIWPIVESFVTSGRHGPAMRSALARFNLTWMPATLLPMFAMAPIIEEHGRWAIGVIALTNLPAIAALRWFAPSPQPHAHDERAVHVSAEYPLLLRSARILLPVSYLLSAAVSPLLPYRFDEIGVEEHWQTPSAATWMVARLLTALVMWRLPFWHGRWGTLLVGGVSIAAGFAGVVLAPTLAVMLGAFAVLGLGMGLIYYAAIYYAMAVGGAAVDSGGTHEGLIGAGYAVGPAACLAGTALGGPAAIVGILWAIVGLSVIPAMLPYFRARARRTGRLR